MAAEARFSYREAFDRNIGWLTEWEQQALRYKKVAIAGMGGVGGFHLLSLARFGIGAFHIADLDRFEVANFNRQIGATVRTLQQPKVDTLAEMALALNPTLQIMRFPDGVRPETVDAFLSGVDLFIDGFDFFVLDIRRKVFARCAELGIPALTAAPVGMGVGFVAFTRDGMAFEDYFRFEGRSELRQYIHFLLGVAPSGIHRAYLADPSRLDFGRRAAPSTVAGVQLAASVTATAAVKLLLGRGGVLPAPYHHHYDAYVGKVVNTRLRWGNAGPLQTLKARAAETYFAALLRQGPKPEPVYPTSVMEEIIDLARWAPSGDNAQPWRFRIVDANEMVVSIRCKRTVYEYRDGEPTLLSGGMLLASLAIAATAFGFRMRWTYLDFDGETHRIACRFEPGGEVDGLCSVLPMRSVDRRSYRTTPLTPVQEETLAATLEDGLGVDWLAGRAQRQKLAAVIAASTDIRLRIPETFEVHRDIIDWRQPRSPSGIPSGALGLDKTTLLLMRWAMRSWRRMDLLNRVAGTYAATLQMDRLPGRNCAAYFIVRPSNPGAAGAERVPGLLAAGERLQRFWLTATKLGLAIQPTLAPLAFAHWGRTGAEFTTDPRPRAAAARLAGELDRVLGCPAADVIFMGRIGHPRTPSFTRSTRLPFHQLIEHGAGR